MSEHAYAAPRQPDYGPHRQQFYALLARIFIRSHKKVPPLVPYTVSGRLVLYYQCPKCRWSCTWNLDGSTTEIDVPWCEFTAKGGGAH